MAPDLIASQLYKQANLLRPEEAYRQAEKTRSKERQLFFMMLGDYLIQKKQKKLIEENIF